MNVVMIPCMTCGDLSPASYCQEHKPQRNYAAERSDRKWTGAWRKLSRKARALQPYCTACGTSDNLSCDHKPEAWLQDVLKLPIELADVDVLCGPCNTYAGSSKPGEERFEVWLDKPDSIAFLERHKSSRSRLSKVVSIYLENDPHYSFPSWVETKLGRTIERPGGVLVQNMGVLLERGRSSPDGQLEPQIGLSGGLGGGILVWEGC